MLQVGKSDCLDPPLVDTAHFGTKHGVGRMVEFFEADHVLFGTESPFDPEHSPAFIRDTIADVDVLAVDDPARQRIDEGNVRRVRGARSKMTTFSPG